MTSYDNSDSQPDPPPAGVVELREDVPLKAGAGGGGGGARCCGGGPRFIIACFALLTAAITLALLTQIYYGDYELVPHGSVSSSAAACSRAGTDALKAGGSALDAAAAAALCLALLAPHRTSLDASGSMLLWEYRRARSVPPVLLEWGGTAGGVASERGPRLVAALATLHARYGRLPWPRLLDPTISLARNGYPVSDGLAVAEAERAAASSALSGAASGAGSVVVSGLAGDTRTASLLGDYLETLQLNSSAELSKVWSDDSNAVRSVSVGAAVAAGTWRVYAGGAGGAVLPAVATTLATEIDPDAAFLTVVKALQQLANNSWSSGVSSGVASGLAVIDRDDTYIALVTGLSVPFGSGPATPEGWTRDDPRSDVLDLAPAIMFQDEICGTRYVIGAETSAALAQAAVALALGGGAAGAVEGARVGVRAGGALTLEAERPAPAALPPALLYNASRPYPATNVVQQQADRLQSHADSRSGGLASRF